MLMKRKICHCGYGFIGIRTFNIQCKTFYSFFISIVVFEIWRLVDMQITQPVTSHRISSYVMSSCAICILNQPQHLVDYDRYQKL